MNQISVPTEYEAYLQSEQFDKLRQKVLARDGNKCIVCGEADTLQIHHLTYRNIYHEDTGDLVTLCRRCHAIYHAVDRRRQAVDRYYSLQDQKERAQYISDNKKQERESKAIEEEIKAEYLPKDYCKGGDLDMTSWEVLNPVIAKKCKQHGLRYWSGSKKELQSYFHYRRCEFLLRCMDKGLSYQGVLNGTKFDSQWLAKWYRRDKCEAKLNEEKELLKED